MFRYCSTLIVTTESSFPFLVNILGTSIRVSDHLVTIIPWLYQHCSTRLEYILVVFRIVVTPRSPHSVFLGLSGEIVNSM